MTDTILIDLDNTLLDFDAAERSALRRTFTALGLEPEESILRRYSQINLSFWKKLEKQEITRPQLKIGRFRQLFDECGIEADPAQTQNLYENNLAHSPQILPGAEALLKELKKSFRIYVVTNGTAIVQHTRIGLSGLGQYFDDVFISEEIGVDKPSREYFTACFEKIPDFDPEKTVLIGDSLSSDITGGKNAGLKTLWLAPDPQASSPLPDWTVHSLEEIPGRLQQISGN